MTNSRMRALLLIAATICVACAGAGAADELDVTFKRHASGATEAVSISGDYTYIGQGQDLVVLDITNPALPVEVVRLTTADFVEDIAVSGSYAYIAENSEGLLIVDVSNPAAPILAGSCDAAGWASGVAVSGDYAYVASGYSGLVIVDISNKSAPTLAGSCETGGSSLDVFVSGDYAYVAEYDDLAIVDISNKTEPTLAGSYGTIEWAKDVFATGNYAYVADHDNGLVILRMDASGTEPPTNVVAIENVTLQPGATRDVPIQLLNSTGVCNGTVTLTFNRSLVNVTNAVAGDFDSVFTPDYSDVGNGILRVTFVKSGHDLTGNRTITTITLDAAVTNGSCELGLSAELTDKSGGIVSSSTDNGTFAISDRVPGDVTGDCEGDSSDATLLFNWVSFPDERGTTYVLQ